MNPSRHSSPGQDRYRSLVAPCRQPGISLVERSIPADHDHRRCIVRHTEKSQVDQWSEQHLERLRAKKFLIAATVRERCRLRRGRRSSFFKAQLFFDLRPRCRWLFESTLNGLHNLWITENAVPQTHCNKRLIINNHSRRLASARDDSTTFFSTFHHLTRLARHVCHRESIHVSTSLSYRETYRQIYGHRLRF